MPHPQHNHPPPGADYSKSNHQNPRNGQQQGNKKSYVSDKSVCFGLKNDPFVIHEEIGSGASAVVLTLYFSILRHNSPNENVSTENSAYNILIGPPLHPEARPEAVVIRREGGEPEAAEIAARVQKAVQAARARGADPIPAPKQLYHAAGAGGGAARGRKTRKKYLPLPKKIFSDPYYNYIT